MSKRPSSLPTAVSSGSLRQGSARLPGVATAAAVGLIGWLGWVEVATVAEQRAAGKQMMQATELRDGITRLDELLTLLARGAAQTGDKRWAERYEETSPQLDSAIAQAVALAEPPSVPTIVRQIPPGSLPSRA